MPWEGRITGWDIFKASFEKDDPKFKCMKSSAVNSSAGLVVGGALGFIMTNSLRGVWPGGCVGAVAVFVGSHCYCVFKKSKEGL